VYCVVLHGLGFRAVGARQYPSGAATCTESELGEEEKRSLVALIEDPVEFYSIEINSLDQIHFQARQVIDLTLHRDHFS
jgi:hypothetical protein